MTHLASNHASSATDIVAAYEALAKSLAPELSSVCVYDRHFKRCGKFSTGRTDPMRDWIKSLHWQNSRERLSSTHRIDANTRWLAVPIEKSDGRLLGVFGAALPGAESSLHPSGAVAKQLKPLLDCIRRDLEVNQPNNAKVRTLIERAAELEWLFELSSGPKSGGEDKGKNVIEALLCAATVRLGSVLGVFHVPDKRLTFKWSPDTPGSLLHGDVWQKSAPHLLNWAQRQQKPLVVNQARLDLPSRRLCKVLSVPILRDNGRVLGVMAFYNPAAANNFSAHHVFLASHIGRYAASLVESQFDSLTGLYTRSGLEQSIGRICDTESDVEQSVLYLDIDHMHVANELYGFEVGNELIIHVGELLSPPLLPPDAMAARISDDRYAVVFPRSGCDEARRIAEELRAACSKLMIGPAGETFDVSLSGGVAMLLPFADGLPRAIAAAEIACKTAKQRGRNRIEIYEFEDGSMMRRHQDAMRVGQLRSALKADRLLLYAQRIQPLQNPELPGGYELLLRLQEVNGDLVMPGPLIEAAQRYQLLPAVDRWVAQRALRVLAPFRAMLRSREIGMSINVSGQSLGNESFIEQFEHDLKEANLPRNCVSIELTEQAAVSNLAHAARMVQRLSALGCRFALDDFGTGANSLNYLKALQTYRVKIDGAFVRDLLTNANSLATVRAIVELARSLHIETVAEFVEDQPTAAELRRLGVDYAQGYAFGRPQPLTELLQQLTEDESARLHHTFLET